MPRAEAADAGLLLRLNGAVQALHARLFPLDFKPLADPVEGEAFFAGRLAEPDWTAGIAAIDGAPVGYVLFALQARAETAFAPARRRVHIEQISVETAARRQGAGSALMAYVDGWAAERGVAEVTLGAWSANAGALAFFAAHGFAPHVVSLRKWRAGGD